MEEQNDAVSRGESSLFDGSAHWWWAMGSGAQIMWGVRCIRRGYAGDNRLMPVKAFGIASLFVGAIATTSVAFLSASGIHTVSPRVKSLISFSLCLFQIDDEQNTTQVQDAIDMGASIRTNLGITPQIPDKQITGTPSFRGL
ncbi:unnamed protein product [Brassica rapa]|uniref:Uncharacterized protein n=2 Tax=Brassica TaxID=3705 RepID=A0A8D9CW39_BRACM|nr:unnamed protein product [Brassica napus]CAG7866065.1 unnamed protein product [Brassica rapa]